MARTATTSDLVYFIHVPKTAGSALRRRMRQEYRSGFASCVPVGHEGLTFEDFCALGPDAQREVTALAAHRSGGLGSATPGRTVRPFTFLRDPVEAAVSRYYYLKLDTNPGHGRQVQGLDIDEFFAGRPNPFTTFLSRRTLPRVDAAGPPDETDLVRALAVLEECEVVGLTEDMPSSIALLRRAFGWSHQVPAQVNVTPDRPSLDSMSRAHREAIVAHTRLDAELYAQAVARHRRDLGVRRFATAVDVRSLRLRSSSAPGARAVRGSVRRVRAAADRLR